MKLSKLIADCRLILETFGDREVFYEDLEGNGDPVESVDFDNDRRIVVLRETPCVPPRFQE